MRSKRPLSHVRAPLPAAELFALRSGLMASPLVARSTLAGTFQSSRGFAFVFKSAGARSLEARYPFLAPYFRFVFSRKTRDALRPRWPLFTEVEPPNAFYMNLLLVPVGASVGRHVDATLAEPSGIADVTPWQVSVLYLDVPKPARGGELLLFRGQKPIAGIRPREGHALHFDGDLAHEVRAFESADPNAVRASLVLEQYRFEADALARLPELWVQSKAGFGAYLEDHAARPPGDFSAE